MVALLDKLNGERHGFHGKIIWSYFNKKDYFKACTLNFSRDGSYFETDQALGAGVTVLIRVLNCFEKNIRSENNECIRWNAPGEVKWCRDLTA